TYTLTGTQLTGLSEGASYGDDAEMSSNYPIVRLTSGGGTVTYARTYGWTPGMATGSAPGTTQVQLPASLAPGTYSLEVVDNGMASTPMSLTVAAPPTVYADTRWATLNPGDAIADADPVAAGNQPATFGTDAFASVNDAIAAAASSGGVVVVNGDTGGTFGNFNEAVNVNAAVGLVIQSGPVTFGSLADPAAGALITLGSGSTLTVGGDNSSTQINGTIAGPGALTKAGSGTLTLAGTDTHSG